MQQREMKSKIKKWMDLLLRSFIIFCYEFHVNRIRIQKRIHLKTVITVIFSIISIN